MINYRDMTFCTAKSCQKFGRECSRSFTDRVQLDAEIWWGGRAGSPPVAKFTDPEKLECYVPKAGAQPRPDPAVTARQRKVGDIVMVDWGYGGVGEMVPCEILSIRLDKDVWDRPTTYVEVRYNGTGETITTDIESCRDYEPEPPRATGG